MLISTIIIFGILILVLLILGFFLKPPNPYLILFASMILLMLTFSALVEGIDIKIGTNTTIERSFISNQTITSSNHTKIVLNETSTKSVIDTYKNLNNTDLRFNGIWISILLLSLYLAYFSISEIIEHRYGKGFE